MPALKRNRKAGKETLLAFLLIFIVILPILAIAFRLDFSPNESWDHFRTFLLKDVVWDTLHVTLLSVLLATVFGVFSAVSLALFDFPLKRYFKWLLFVPITIPPYVAAYVYAGMLGYTGVVQTTLRRMELPHDPAFFNIMHRGGAVFVFAITLYPYVYGVVRSFLENHSANFIDIARVHGYRPLKIFWKVVLPLIRVPLIGGATLVGMEVLSDYGVVRYFNIQTVSAAIFRSWFASGNTIIAVRLSFYVMVFILLFQGAEELLLGRKKYSLGASQPRPLSPIPLKGWRMHLVMALLVLLLLISFLFPVLQLLHWSYLAMGTVSLPNLSRILFNTVFLAGVASLLIVLLNGYIAHVRRWLNRNAALFLARMTQLGYSIPGAIIAIGTITLFVALDGQLYPLYSAVNPDTRRLVLSTSLVMLVFAYIARYMAVGFNTVNAAFMKVGTKYNEAARIMGTGRTRAMLRVELPLMKNALIAGFILTFIDILKELPLTLLLRPFNYNSLATRVYEYANDERIVEAALPALLLIAISVLFLTILANLSKLTGGPSK